MNLVLIHTGLIPAHTSYNAHQVLLNDGAERCYARCNIFINQTEAQTTFFTDTMWTYESCFSWYEIYNRQNTVNNHWKALWYRLIGQVFNQGTFTCVRFLGLLQDVIIGFVENLSLLQLLNIRSTWMRACAQDNITEAVPGGEIRKQIFGYTGFLDKSPRSLYLAPINFILREYIKQQMYVTPLSTF